MEPLGNVYSTIDNCKGGRGKGIRLSWKRRMGARMSKDLRRSVIITSLLVTSMVILIVVVYQLISLVTLC